jgi:hypothetical protein
MIPECFIAAWCATIYATALETGSRHPFTEQYLFDDEIACEMFKSIWDADIGKVLTGKGLPQYHRSMIIETVTCSHPGRI